MGLRIRLLGRPGAERDGVPVAAGVRRKGWALLAVLLLAERPVRRRAAAELLFPDAADPLGALRWTLSRLRTALGGELTLDGDPIVVGLPSDCEIDALTGGSGTVLTDASGIGTSRTLLEGFDGTAGADFDVWLLTAREQFERRPRLRTRLDIRSLIEVGRATMAAGAPSAGIAHLRAAADAARRGDDEALRAAALLELGGSFVHAVGAGLPEGVRALHTAAGLARDAGDGRSAAEALRDLAYVENARGAAAPARRLLMMAVDAAGSDTYALSAVHAIGGMYLADRGRHHRALHALRRSVELAETAGRVRQAAYSHSMISRTHLHLGDIPAARDHAERAATIAAEQRWVAMRPWIDGLRAETDLATGRLDDAERRLADAWSLSLVLGDRCWQAMAARGLGLVAYARGDIDAATRWLDEAVTRAAHEDDRFAWTRGWVAEAVCRVTVAAGLARASADVEQLAAVATANRQPEFLVHADLHRATLGDRDAAARAGARAATLENPALAATAGSRC